MNNRFIISAAGSGKTTYLVDKALSIKDQTVLITTYTEANLEEIKKKIVDKKGFIPRNITIMTWFTFLLKHGVRPYQSVIDKGLHDKKIGFYLSNQKSGHRYGKVYWGEQDLYKFYFTNSMKIYSDKISKFILRCNKESKGQVIRRISRIFRNIFIDEVQDLAGYDFDILRLLFELDNFVLIVGDPRQVTYLTHHTPKYKKYNEGKLHVFISEMIDQKMEICSIDTTTLNTSHRNNDKICYYSAKLYPNLPIPRECCCKKCRENRNKHCGVFLIKQRDVDEYLQKYNPMQLRWDKRKKVNNSFPVKNMGESKGLTFKRVLFYPTDEMINWIKNNNTKLKNSTRAKFYVGLTRSRFSTAIVMNYNENDNFDGLDKYSIGQGNG